MASASPLRRETEVTAESYAVCQNKPLFKSLIVAAWPLRCKEETNTDASWRNPDRHPYGVCVCGPHSTRWSAHTRVHLHRCAPSRLPPEGALLHISASTVFQRLHPQAAESSCQGHHSRLLSEAVRVFHLCRGHHLQYSVHHLALTYDGAVTV